MIVIVWLIEEGLRIGQFLFWFAVVGFAVYLAPLILYPVAKPINNVIEKLRGSPVPPPPPWWGPVMGAMLLSMAVLIIALYRT